MFLKSSAKLVVLAVLFTAGLVKAESDDSGFEQAERPKATAKVEKKTPKVRIVDSINKTIVDYDVSTNPEVLQTLVELEKMTPKARAEKLAKMNMKSVLKPVTDNTDAVVQEVEFNVKSRDDVSSTSQCGGWGWGGGFGGGFGGWGGCGGFGMCGVIVAPIMVYPVVYTFGMMGCGWGGGFGYW